MAAKMHHNVYRYDDPEVNESVSIDVNEDGHAVLSVSVGGLAAIKRMPLAQLTQMLYRLRDERSRTVTAELAVDNTPKKEEGK